jgi:formate hydrogenlyase transcriptional activator
MGTPASQPHLLQIVNALIGCRGLQEFDRVLARSLAQQIGSDVTGFYLYSQTANAFSPVSDQLIDPNSPAYSIGQLPAGGTMKEAAVRAGRALLANDLVATSWTEARAIPNLGQDHTSVVVAPLTLPPGDNQRHAKRTIAVMAAIAFGKWKTFGEDERLFLETLGTQLAPVLQNVLASEERDTLMAINSRVAVGTMTIDQLMPAVQDILRRVIRHDMTGLVRFVTSTEGPWFDIVHMDGVNVELSQLRQFPFERMAPAELIETGKPLLITGHNHERFPERSYIESVGILSCMLCPLIVRGAPYGFLAIGSKRRNAFSERDLGLAEQIGFQLSHAIANLVAYEEIRLLKEQLERENVYLREEISASVDFKELVGESPPLQKTLKAIEKVAPTDSTVLIMGETGTGKELVAQAIHHLSPRKDKPLIRVNCAALPPTLIESELFGHEKGAFTNALARKIGRFELANGGTIFLDEVGEIPLDLQAKLLRVLEAQELERVGGTHTLTLNVRVLAATNIDLEQAVKVGTFRADLFYRLKVFPIRIPPLRERLDDVPALARHFVKKYCARHRKRVTRISSATLKALASYPWPGNVRELEHLIERAVILAQGPVLTIDELEHDAQGDGEAHSSRTLAEAERAHILDTLHQTNWVLAGRHGAAMRLGMKRSTLQHRMKKLGIRRPSRRT